MFVLKYRVLQFVFAISTSTAHNGLGNGFVSYLVTQFMHLLKTDKFNVLFFNKALIDCAVQAKYY